MAYDWNPDAPKNLGLEHAKVGNLAALIDQAAKAYMVRWRAQSAAAVDHVLLPAAPGSSSPSKSQTNPSFGPWGMVMADLVQTEVVSGSPSVVSSFNPTAVAGVGGWTSSTGGAAVLADLTTGGRYMKSTAPGDAFTVQFGTGAFSLTATHILGIRFVIQASAPVVAGLLAVEVLHGSGGWADFTANLVVPVTGAVLTAPTQYVAYGELWQGAASQAFTWITGQGVRDLASGGTRKLRVRNIGAAGNEVQIDSITVDIIGIPELRLATGVARPVANPFTALLPGYKAPIDDAAWCDFAMLKPDKSGAFSTVNATDYTIRVRRPADLSSFGDQAGTLALRRLKGAPKFAHLTMRPAATYDVASAFPSFLPMSVVSADDDVTPAVRFQTGTTDRGESQPYMSVSAGSIALAGNGGSAVDAGQVFTAGASGTFPLLQIDVSADLGPIKPLTVKVKIEGGADVTATATITTDDADAAPAVGSIVTAHLGSDNPAVSVQMRRVTVDFAAWGAVTPLVSGTVYRVCVNSLTPGIPAFGDGPWLVAGMWQSVTAPGGEAQTFQGSTGYATGIVIVEHLATDTAHSTVNGDLMLVLATKPVTPTGFAAVIRDQPMEAGGDCGTDHCIPDHLPYAHLSWTATAVGSDFGGYLIERSDPRDSAWTAIGLVTDEDTVTFDDYEGRLNTASSYRLRAVRLLDGAVSDPTSTVTLTRTVEDCGYAFTSNEDPTLNLAYPDVTESGTARRGYTFPEADETVFQRLYGRDYQVAFRPTETRGAVFQRSVLVNAVCAAPEPGVYGFDALRALATAPLSYVAVLDDQGARFLAHLQVPSGDTHQPAALQLATVTVTEVTDTPSTPG